MILFIDTQLKVSDATVRSEECSFKIKMPNLGENDTVDVTLENNYFNVILQHTDIQRVESFDGIFLQYCDGSIKLVRFEDLEKSKQGYYPKFTPICISYKDEIFDYDARTIYQHMRFVDTARILVFVDKSIDSIGIIPDREIYEDPFNFFLISFIGKDRKLVSKPINLIELYGSETCIEYKCYTYDTKVPKGKDKKYGIKFKHLESILLSVTDCCVDIRSDDEFNIRLKTPKTLVLNNSAVFFEVDKISLFYQYKSYQVVIYDTRDSIQHIIGTILYTSDSMNISISGDEISINDTTMSNTASLIDLVSVDPITSSLKHQTFRFDEVGDYRIV